MSQVKGHSKLGGPRVPHVPLLATLGLLLSVLLGSGCARRLDLTPTELKRIEGPDGDLKLLRVYPKKKLISLYREEEVQESYEVNKRKITERGAYRPFKRIIGKKIAGKVVARTEQNGMPVLWIAFDNTCTDTACSRPRSCR